MSQDAMKPRELPKAKRSKGSPDSAAASAQRDIASEIETAASALGPNFSPGSGETGPVDAHPPRPSGAPAAARPTNRASRPFSPLSVLLPYQRDWVDDDARFKIGCWSRQTGKSFSTAAETVRDCAARKTTWVTLSAGERQALEWMLKAREWAEAFQLSVAEYTEERDSVEALMKSAEIRWPNGSRLVAIPANPSTARGYSANLTLDEFAFHEQPDAIWRAIYPSISNPLKGVYKIRIVSTPNGLGNKFADLWNKPGKWSKHLVDIHTAVARGLPVNIEELRAGLDDPEGWAQEYECQFLDAAAILLSYDLIAGVENPEATATIAPEYWHGAGATPVVMGIDFGRKRDLTVAWSLELLPGGFSITREVLDLPKTSTPDQVEILRSRIRRARRVTLDYTGPGVGLGDYLVKEFGEYDPKQDRFGKIKLLTFTNAVKQELFPRLRAVAESKKVGIPASRAIREDLHSIHRVTTQTGQITYRAPHTEDGHADRATALALALDAGASAAAGAITRVAGIVLPGSAYTPTMYRPWRLAAPKTGGRPNAV